MEQKEYLRKLSLEQLEAIHKEKMDNYYDVKRTCNHTTDSELILSRWKTAEKYFEDARIIWEVIKEKKENL